MPSNKKIILTILVLLVINTFFLIRSALLVPTQNLDGTINSAGSLGVIFGMIFAFVFTLPILLSIISALIALFLNKQKTFKERFLNVFLKLMLVFHILVFLISLLRIFFVD